MTSQMLRNHFRGAKRYAPPMEREHFRCCISVKALINANIIAGGRKESTTKDIKVLKIEFVSLHAWLIIADN